MELLVTPVHHYGVDTSERTRIAFLLAVTSIVLGWGVYWSLQPIEIPLLWLVGPPSAMGFFALLNQAFDKYIWSLRLTRKLLLTHVPNLNGTWQGCLESFGEGNYGRLDATLVITQSWTRMAIALRTDQSESVSRGSMLLTQDPLGTLLSYEYLNEPRASATPTMHIHRGLARLTFEPQDGREMLVGDYFTGRDRHTHGTLSFEKVSSK